MAFIGEWFTFGFDPDYDDGVRAFERGDDESAVPAFRASRNKASEPSQRERATTRLLASLLRLGNKMSTLGNHTAAREALAEAVLLRPRFADVRLTSAWINFAAGSYELAASESQASLAINPGLAPAFIVLGLSQVCLGEETAGFALVRSHLAEWRTSTDVAKKALLAWQQGDTQAAVTIAKTVRPKPVADMDSFIAEGDLAMKNREFHEAESYYRQVLAVKPNYADVRVKRGQALLQVDEVDAALNEFSEAVTINPRYAAAWALIGVAYRRLREEDEALEAFRHALSIDKDEPIANHEIGRRR